MGMLDSIFGGGAMQENPFAQYQQMQANPFTRMIPGSEYLSGMPGQGMQEMQGFPSTMSQSPENPYPTDFAGVPPGLPNLPEDLQGFGFGQTAPQMNTNSNLRQNLIQQLLKQLMSQGGMGGQAGGMMQPSPMGDMSSMYGMDGMNRSGL